MTDSLSAEQRTELERLIGRARTLLEDDLVAQAAGRYGIDPDGRIADESTLRLDSSRLSDRRGLVEVVEHLRTEGDSPSEAVARLIREAVFTHLNRLVAIRIAEALGLLPESLAQGERSQGYRDIKELAPLLAADETNGYWLYLQICGDELAGDVPNLFDPRNPLLALAPSPAALRDLVALFADTGVSDIWTAPDCLGWAYQFFNRAEERKRIHEAGAPSDARELAIANQFFTPRYVVDFLIQNSLGRRLLEADPASPLADDLPLLINAPTHPGPVLELSDVSVLDPACGSGHFLVGAYDLLERSWNLAGVPPAEAAPNILRALWGIDIDARCTQVAAAALIFRARRSAPTTELPRPNVICARALPPMASHLDDLLAGLPETRRELVRELIDTLGDAPVLGPLLKVEDRLSAQARAGAFGVRTDEGSLADALPIEALDEVESDLLTAVAQLADAATASPTERLLAAEADDVVRFIAAMQRRYTVVLMNPPFGAPVASTKPYLKAAYPWIPATSDLFALFVGRGLELCSSDGYVGAITSRVGMFLSSFEDWRRTIFLGHELPVLADLGEGVMEQAMVEAVAYVLGKRRRQPHARSVFVRAVTAKDRASVVQRASQSLRNGHEDESIFLPDLDRLTRLSGAPVPYWVDPESIDVLARHKAFEPTYGQVRVGLQTSDDFQFVRAWWEVEAKRLTRSPSDADGANEVTQLARGARWAPIVKAGASQPWFSPVFLVVDWERDGERIRAFGKTVVSNTEFYFRPGFSWTRRAPRLVPHLVPAGCIPSISRYQAFPSGDPSAAVGLVASNVASAYCRFFGEKFLWPNFLVGNVKTLPVPEIDEELAAALAQRVREGVDERRAVYKHLEPYREFTVPVRDVGTLKWNPGSLLGDDLEHRVAAAYGLAPEQAAQLELDMREALQTLGMLESEVGGDDEEIGAIPAWEERLLSYLVGLSFGRWDIRIALNPGCAPSLPNPFDPLPVNPPGMLVGEDGLPAEAAPAGYPLELPPAGLLVDSAGDSWDIEARILQAASQLFDDPDVECERFAASLGRRSLRQYVRKQFFKDHLRTYSKGRRRAPIYWPLYVPSGEWGVWVYAPSFTRETLFAIESAAKERLNAAEAEIGRLRREQNGGGGRSERELANALDAEERLAEELEIFAREAGRIAALGWEPDLDDGIVLCAAPLAKLFPAWKDAARERENIKAGKYPWASVSKWADKL